MARGVLGRSDHQLHQTRGERWPFTGRRLEMAAARVAVLDESTNGVVIVGEAGVGRTRFAEELTADVERSGHRVARATADATSSALPLGALAHLLSPEVVIAATRDVPLDPTRLLAEARRVLGDVDGRLVLMIDDAHLLDAVVAGPVGAARARESGGARGDRAVRRAAARRSPVALAERPAATLRPGSARRRRGQHAVAPGPRWAGRRACRAGPARVERRQSLAAARAGPRWPRPTACSFRSTGCGR